MRASEPTASASQSVLQTFDGIAVRPSAMAIATGAVEESAAFPACAACRVDRFCRHVRCLKRNAFLVRRNPRYILLRSNRDRLAGSQRSAYSARVVSPL